MGVERASVQLCDKERGVRRGRVKDIVGAGRGWVDNHVEGDGSVGDFYSVAAMDNH